MLTLNEIYIYPVKSLGGLALQETEVTNRGLKHDRRWMLVDEQGRFLSQRTSPNMALFKLVPETGGFRVIYMPDGSSVIIRFSATMGESLPVTIWDDTCTGTLVDTEADRWFSARLNCACRLVYMADDALRPVDERYAKQAELVSFADAYPTLLIGQASIDYLNQQLPDPVEADRFRPNLIFTGGYAHQEDQMAHITINHIDFYGVKPCARCVMIGINQQTGRVGKEPAKTLATYRQWNKKVYFGQNLLHQGCGKIRVGDEVHIQSLKPDFMELPADIPLYTLA